MLLDHNLISHYADLFTLTEGDLKDLPSFKEKAASNVILAIDKARQVQLYRLLIGLSIENIGEETARLIADTFGSLESIAKATEAEVAAIHGVGETVAESLVDWFKDKNNRSSLAELLPHLEIQNPALNRNVGSQKGNTFVLTGTLSSLTRDEAKDLIRKSGGSISSSVSRKTTFVVVGDNPGSKAAEAERLGVPILSEAEFKALVA